MGKWNDILNDTTLINADWSYASVINDFVKGMAYAKTGNIPEAEKHLSSLQEKMNDTVLQVKFAPYSSTPYECSIVAENILSATISFEQKKYDAALSTIQKATTAEDKLLYAEPKEWMLPARQYLGAYLLQLNKAKEAEKVYRKDLVWNPGNGWSLLGLYQSLAAQNKITDAAPYKPRYMNSFSHADVLPTTSAY
jgi:tetratricopeptide (TPR) repeat protein